MTSIDKEIHYDEFESANEQESLLRRNTDDTHRLVSSSAESKRIFVYLETFVCLFIIATLWSFLASHKHHLPKATAIAAKAKVL